MRTSWMFAGALWVVLGGQARVQRAFDSGAEAALWFEVGISACATHDYRGALEHLVLSNRLAANRSVLFHIAPTRRPRDGPEHRA